MKIRLEKLRNEELSKLQEDLKAEIRRRIAFLEEARKLNEERGALK